MIIYLLRNILNDKIYVGQTKNTLNERWKRHVNDSKRGITVIARAIHKYGPESFVREIVFEGDVTQSELDEIEKSIISERDSINNGYNIAVGGQGGKLCEDFGERVSQGKLKMATKRPDARLRLQKRSKEEICRIASIGGKAIKGVPKKGDRARKGSQLHHNAKTYVVTSPFGEVTTVTNLSEFCRQHGLCKACMMLCASPKRLQNKSHKGWLCERTSNI